MRLTLSEAEAGEQPRSRAAPRAESLLFPHSRSVAACSDLASLEQRFCFFSAMILIFFFVADLLRASPGTRILELNRTRPTEFEREDKVFGSTC